VLWLLYETVKQIWVCVFVAGLAATTFGHYFFPSAYHKQWRIYLCSLCKTIRRRHLSRLEVTWSLDSDVPCKSPYLHSQHFSAFGRSSHCPAEFSSNHQDDLRDYKKILAGELDQVWSKTLQDRWPPGPDLKKPAYEQWCENEDYKSISSRIWDKHNIDKPSFF